MPNLSALFITPAAQLQQLKDLMYKSVNLQNLSSLSLRLMVGAQWGDVIQSSQWGGQATGQYAFFKTQMLQLLKINENFKEDVNEIAKQLSAREAWMIGRMVVSALWMDDAASAHLASIINAFINREDIRQSPDAYSVWAQGYLLEYQAQKDKDEYQKNITPALTAANKVIVTANEKAEFSTIAWIHVVNLHAAAVAQDPLNYYKVKLALAQKNIVVINTQAIPEMTTEYMLALNSVVLDTLMQIPESDFRVWAYFWTLRAATAMEDHGLVSLLNENAKAILPAETQLNDMEHADATAENMLRNDYVLGITSQLFAEFHAKLQPKSSVHNQAKY